MGTTSDRLPRYRKHLSLILIRSTSLRLRSFSLPSQRLFSDHSTYHIFKVRYLIICGASGEPNPRSTCCSDSFMVKCDSDGALW